MKIKFGVLLLPLVLLNPHSADAEEISIPTTFLGWCENYRRFPEGTRKAVADLIKTAYYSGAKDCKTANTVLSKMTSYNTSYLVADLRPVSSLRNLKKLSIDRMGDSANISPLSFMTELEEIYIGINSKTDDLQPLSSLKRLKKLHISYIGSKPSSLKDVSPLRTLRNLEHLGIRGTQLSNVEPLSSLTKLTELYLSNNQIADIKPLSSLINLRELDLQSNKITDIQSLSSLSNLKRLYLGGNSLPKNSCPLFESVCR
jgi:internalin A